MSKFETYNVSLQLIDKLRPLVAMIATHDRDLADQIRRAGSSVPLNICEGSKRVGRDRNHSFRIAAGSAAEVRAALAVACGWGYLNSQDAKAADDLLDRVLALLWRITHPCPTPKR